MNKRLISLIIASTTTLVALGLGTRVIAKADSLNSNTKEIHSLENISKLNKDSKENVKEIKTGWQFIDGKTYFFNKNGSMKTGWHVVKYQGKTFKYYLKSTGEKAFGWEKINDKLYYFDTEVGDMKTGWQFIDGKTYFFNKNGSMKTGWYVVKHQNKTFKYYLKSTGERASGWEKINNKFYYFDTEVGNMIKSKKL